MLAHAFFHPKTVGDNKLNLKTPQVISQDTTAESKKNPHLVESLTIGQSSIKMANRILNNKSTLNSDAKSIGEQTPAHKYKSIDFDSAEQAKASSVIVAGNSNITPKQSNADKASIITNANSINRKSALDMIEEGNSRSKREGDQSDEDDSPNQVLAVSGKN